MERSPESAEKLRNINDKLSCKSEKIELEKEEYEDKWHSEQLQDSQINELELGLGEELPLIDLEQILKDENHQR